jgi:hypothetical protein
LWFHKTPPEQLFNEIKPIPKNVDPSAFACRIDSALNFAVSKFLALADPQKQCQARPLLIANSCRADREDSAEGKPGMIPSEQPFAVSIDGSEVQSRK